MSFAIPDKMRGALDDLTISPPSECAHQAGQLAQSTLRPAMPTALEGRRV